MTGIVVYHWVNDNPHTLEFAEKAYKVNPNDFHTLWVLAHIQDYSNENRRRFAVANYRRLIEMNPNIVRV